MWWLIIPAATFVGGLAVRKAAQRIRESREERERAAADAAVPAETVSDRAAALDAAAAPPAPGAPAAVAPPTPAGGGGPDRPLTVEDFAERWVSPVLADAGESAPKPAGPARPRPVTLASLTDKIFGATMGLLFLLSFFLDYDALLRTISVSGLIGWGTNWLAVFMLFRPLEPRPLLGHGLIPRKREEFFANISRAVVDNLISEEILHQEIERSGLVRKAAREQIAAVRTVLQSAEFRKDLQDLTLTYVHRIIRSPEFRGRLRAMVEMRLNQGLDQWTGRDMKGKMVEVLKPLWREQVRDEVMRHLEEVIREIPAAVPHFFGRLDQTMEQLPAYLSEQEGVITQVVTRAVTGFVRSLNVRDIVMQRLNGLSNEYLERTVRNTTERQLGFITLAGGLLGAIGGVVIWKPTLIVILPVVGGAVWGVDVALARWGRRGGIPDPQPPPTPPPSAPATGLPGAGATPDPPVL